MKRLRTNLFRFYPTPAARRQVMAARRDIREPKQRELFVQKLNTNLGRGPKFPSDKQVNAAIEAAKRNW